MCFGGGNQNASQTNTNQATVVADQTAQQTAVLSQQDQLFQTIAADIGNDTPNVPTPAGLPSVQAVTGGTLQAPGVISYTSEAGAGIADPNETGLINALNESANGTENLLAVSGQVNGQSLTASQSQTQDAISSSAATAEANVASGANGTNNPLGPQYSFAPVGNDASDPTTTTTSSGGSLVPLLLVGAAGVGIFFFVKHEHKAA